MSLSVVPNITSCCQHFRQHCHPSLPRNMFERHKQQVFEDSMGFAQSSRKLRFRPEQTLHTATRHAFIGTTCTYAAAILQQRFNTHTHTHTHTLQCHLVRCFDSSSVEHSLATTGQPNSIQILCKTMFVSPRSLPSKASLLENHNPRTASQLRFTGNQHPASRDHAIARRVPTFEASFKTLQKEKSQASEKSSKLICRRYTSQCRWCSHRGHQVWP